MTQHFVALNNESLINFLNEKKLNPQVQKQTNQVYFITKIKEKEFPSFLRLDPEGKILQVLVFLPTAIRPKAPAETARMLHYINKEIDLPGFGMDERLGVVFYRCTLPTSHGKLDKEILELVVQSGPAISNLFLPFIEAVNNGAYFESISSDLRDAMMKIAEHQKEGQK